MPFTPFHLGPGYLAATAARPRWFSFYVFALSQLVIDLETLRNLFFGAERLHTFFHTFLGSLVAAVATLAIYRILFIPLSALFRNFPDLYEGLAHFRLWDHEPPSIKTATLSVWVGAWSHVALDSVHHADVQPFWPASVANSAYNWIGSGELYLGCLVAGIAGLLLVLVSRRST